jgi:hypothetical protein
LVHIDITNLVSEEALGVGALWPETLERVDLLCLMELFEQFRFFLGRHVLAVFNFNNVSILACV